MTRAATGDRAAYAQLVTRYTAIAHRTAYLLGAGGDAEDVVQEAFVKAYRALGTFRAGAPFRPWLLRIVANETRNLHRSARRRTAAELRTVTEPAGREVADRHATDPQTAAESAAERAALLAAVNALPERDRLVLTCRYFLDLSEAETAQVLGWPRGSVKSRLSRALGRLRRAVPDRAGQEADDG